MHNKEYDRLYAKKHRENPEQKRKRMLKLRYGISVEEYDAMFLMQDGKCAICGKRSIKRLCVDHDHKTGRVRGLLCRKCNIMLGFIESEPERIEQIQKYMFL